MPLLVRYFMYSKNTQLVHAQSKYARTMVKLSETSEEWARLHHTLIQNHNLPYR
jgi:hypothetical protein